jgi:membrane associated rhomboid family serine protease/cytochrome c-type biogenesis protein CcmH/NrfG
MANCIRCGRKLPPFSFKKTCQWCVQHEAARRAGDDDDARQQVMPAPWVRRSQSTITLTQFLLGANVAVFIAMVAASGSIEEFDGHILIHFGANFGPQTLSGEWWRLLTYMFVHGGVLHIGFNMWCLWDLGALCESLYGRWTYAAIYLLTGIAGGATSIGWNPGILSVGASGAIFGLAGALIASFYLGEFSLPSFTIKGTLRSLLFFAAFNIFFGFMFPGIDNSCHFGGLISGLLLGALIAKLAPHTEIPFRRVSVLALGALIVGLSTFGVVSWRGAPYRAARAFETLMQSGSGDPVARLEAIVRAQPNLAEAHFDLGREYFNQNRLPQAEVEFKRVVELEPQNPQAQVDLGLTYLAEKRDDDAKALFQQMLAHDAKSAEGHYGMGLVLADQQKHQAAVDEFKTAINLDPQASGISYEMGRSYAQLKMYDDAIAAYLNEKKKTGDDPDLENALAEAYQAKGMTKEAQEAKNKAAALRSGTPN